MNNENNKILKIEINEKESKIFKKIDELNEGIFAIFYYILKNPMSNFWWECVSLTIQYSQLLIFIVDDTVSKALYYYNKNKI
jgi:hypothetical protein